MGRPRKREHSVLGRCGRLGNLRGVEGAGQAVRHAEGLPARHARLRSARRRLAGNAQRGDPERPSRHGGHHYLRARRGGHQSADLPDQLVQLSSPKRSRRGRDVRKPLVTTQASIPLRTYQSSFKKQFTIHSVSFVLKQRDRKAGKQAEMSKTIQIYHRENWQFLNKRLCLTLVAVYPKIVNFSALICGCINTSYLDVIRPGQDFLCMFWDTRGRISAICFEFAGTSA